MGRVAEYGHASASSDKAIELLTTVIRCFVIALKGHQYNIVVTTIALLSARHAAMDERNLHHACVGVRPAAPSRQKASSACTPLAGSAQKAARST